MIVDPVATLRRFNPRQIILIGGDGDAPPPEDAPPSDPPSGGPEKMRWRAKYDDGAHRLGAPFWFVGGSEAVVMKSGSFVALGEPSAPAWRLIPYVRRSDPKMVDRFKVVAEVLLEWEPDSFVRRMAVASIRRAAVTRHRALLARAYRHVFGDKNLTSLSLYSGPAEPKRAGAVQLAPKFKKVPSARIGWMGTGDANLRETADIDSFSRHFGADLAFVSTFVLPHHGSIHNSDPRQLVSNADLWVACAEPHHKDWEHPARVLVDAVKRAGKSFCHVRSKPNSALDERMVVFWRR